MRPIGLAGPGVTAQRPADLSSKKKRRWVFITWYPYCRRSDALAEQLGARSYLVHNDSRSENGPYTPQIAMAVSINTAYTDLWHRVGGPAVATMAQQFGVNTDAACITASCGGTGKMENEAGVALGQASLTVVEQATMLATIDNGGVYHSAHIIASIGQNSQNTAMMWALW